MKAQFALALILCLSGCDQAAQAKRPPVEIGRHIFIASNDGYPPMVLDTATGCVEQLSRQGEGEGSVVTKTMVGYAAGEDRMCQATGITGLPFEKMQ